MCTKKGQKFQKRTFKLSNNFKLMHFNMLSIEYYNWYTKLHVAYMPIITPYWYPYKTTTLESKFYTRLFRKSLKSWLQS